MSAIDKVKNLAQSLILLLFTLSFFSCTSKLYVAPKQVDCTGASSQKCYLVRTSTEGNWIMHYQEINGFEYEPGFSYKIKVKREKRKHVSMDGSSYKYILVDILEQKDAAESIALEDLLGKEWILEYLKWEDSQYGIEGTSPTLRFEQSGKVSGNGGCNNLFSTFTLDGRTINMEEIGSTRMMCEGKMELEEAYMKFLNMEIRAIFSDGKLVLSTDGGNRMIFRPN